MNNEFKKWFAARARNPDRITLEEAYQAGLRAKVAEMEKQEPFDADTDVFRSAFEAALEAGNWPATRQGDGYRSPSTQIAWRIAFSTVNRLKLYPTPGAQLAPSVPDHKTIRDLLNESGLCAYDREGDLAFMVAATKFAALAAAPEVAIHRAKGEEK